MGMEDYQQEFVSQADVGAEALNEKADESLEGEIAIMKKEGGKIADLLVISFSRSQLDLIRKDLLAPLGYDLTDIKDGFINDKLNFHMALTRFVESQPNDYTGRTSIRKEVKELIHKA